jgi:hypothetical protein
MPNANPIFDPGQAFTGVATGDAVAGCRVLAVASAKVDGDPLPVAHCGSGDIPIGFSGTDAAENFSVPVYRYQVLELECAGTVTAGGQVEVTTDGKIQDESGGTVVGVAWQSGGNGDFVLVQPTV